MAKQYSKINTFYDRDRSKYVVSLSKLFYPLLSSGSTKGNGNSAQHDSIIVDCDVKHLHKQT